MAVEFPQHVCWADEPVFVGGVKLHYFPILRLDSEDCWSKKRDIVVMKDIVGFIRQ